MKTDQNSPVPSTFSSITEIMEHFRTVPYEQFQQELQSWFEQGLAKQRAVNPVDRQAPPAFANLRELVSFIYHDAELKQLLNESISIR